MGVSKGRMGYDTTFSTLCFVPAVATHAASPAELPAVCFRSGAEAGIPLVVKDRIRPSNRLTQWQVHLTQWKK